MRRLFAAALFFGAAHAGQAQDDGIRGPLGPREEWLLAEPRLTLPALAPDPIEPGRTTIRARLDWGNDFGWSQQFAGELPGDRRFLVDGEHRTLDLEIRRGASARLDVGLRVPLRWRGAGLLDGVIDWWHGLTKKLGLPENSRSFFFSNRFRVEGRDAAGRPLAWTETGTALGNVEADARWAIARSASGRARAAVVARAMLPTGTEAFATRSLGGGLQLVGGRAVGERWDFQAGLGGTLESKAAIDGIRYSRGRVHGFAATEWRTGRRFSLLVETSAASRLIANLARYPGLQWYLNLGARMNLDSGWTIEGAFSENIAQQQATTDFGVQVGVVRRVR